MGRIQAEIKTSFGKIVIEGSDINDLLETLKTMPENFLNELETAISDGILSFKKIKTGGVVKLTGEGPVIVSKNRLTHYEAIGLTLYFSKGKRSTSSQITRLLKRAGINPRVSSRLNEMAKRGLIFKPDPAGVEWKLSSKGEEWIEERVMPRLKPT